MFLWTRLRNFSNKRVLFCIFTVHYSVWSVGFRGCCNHCYHWMLVQSEANRSARAPRLFLFLHILLIITVHLCYKTVIYVYLDGCRHFARHILVQSVALVDLSTDCWISFFHIMGRQAIFSLDGSIYFRDNQLKYHARCLSRYSKQHLLTLWVLANKSIFFQGFCSE